MIDPALQLKLKQILGRAHASLHSAELLHAAGQLSDALSRGYYAAFHAVAALLTAHGKTYSSHSALQAALHRDFLKAGLLPRAVGQSYDRLFSERQQSDYDYTVV